VGKKGLVVVRFGADIGRGIEEGAASVGSAWRCIYGSDAAHAGQNNTHTERGLVAADRLG